MHNNNMPQPMFNPNMPQPGYNGGMMQGGSAPMMQGGSAPMMQGGSAPMMQGGSVPMMQGGSAPMMMQGGANPIIIQQVVVPTQDYLIQNDFYKMGNFSAFYATDYLLALRNARSAFIKQKIEILEMITGCETKNRYNVYLRYDNGVNAYLFKCKEESTWCSRNCLKADCRPFGMKVKFIKNSLDIHNDDFNNPNLVFERPFKCTCFCCER